MAISQPSYPVETNALVTHVGSYTDSELSTHAADETAVHGISDANLLVGYNLFNVSFPSRPDFNVVLWIGGGLADDPSASMLDGDIWFPSEE